MRIPEFFGGLLVGLSVYLTVLSTFYLKWISSIVSTSTVPDKAYIELLIPFVAALIAGLGIGFGLKSEDNSGYGFNFSNWSEHWPALIGGLGLAASIGSLLILYFSNTPASGLIYSFISIVLCVFGIIVAVLNWQASSPY